jgi:hypothetical protein
MKSGEFAAAEVDRLVREVEDILSSICGFVRDKPAHVVPFCHKQSKLLAEGRA